MRGLWLLCASMACAHAAEPALRISVYATAGGIQKYLAKPEGRQRVESALRRLRVSRVFLEGRRGDEYVPPSLLRELRRYFGERGIETTGGIATVPGQRFGTRQVGPLGWLNWESARTREDIARFFRENAAVFDEIVVDDFFCTGDTSPESEKARAGRPWAEYRQDLMTSLIEPLILRPAREVNPRIRLILKYPQWYDRFHMFGYAPARMSPPFDRIWVGTEVRNPETRRMGFVQPTEGYMNFRWISAVAGQKAEGAWFDHIECTARNFVDQAWQSVLAGASELTLFHLGDVVDGHPGHALFEAALPQMMDLAANLRGRAPAGIAYYKPAGSDAGDNMYLMDYLGVMGLPVLPEARFPERAKVIMLGAQAAADPAVADQMARRLNEGATLIVTPAFLRKLGGAGQRLAGARVAETARPGAATEVSFGRRRVALPRPLEIDLDLEAGSARRLIETQVEGASHPILLAQKSGKGQILVWNARTFTEEDFRAAGEWLLAPKPLGLATLPRDLIDELRRCLLGPLRIRFSAPSRVGLYLFEGLECLHNFREEAVEVSLNGRAWSVPANHCACRKVDSAKRL
jgi:hypothetical protein